jgi:hypothetical protein
LAWSQAEGAPSGYSPKKIESLHGRAYCVLLQFTEDMLGIVLGIKKLKGLGFHLTP